MTVTHRIYARHFDMFKNILYYKAENKQKINTESVHGSWPYVKDQWEAAIVMSKLWMCHFSVCVCMCSCHYLKFKDELWEFYHMYVSQELNLHHQTWQKIPLFDVLSFWANMSFCHLLWMGEYELVSKRHIAE